MRLIDLVNGMTVYLYGNDIEKWEKICKDAKEGKIPTITLRGIEYALVRHGHWIKMSDADGHYYACSECGEELHREWSFDRKFVICFPKKITIDKTQFCSHCGAKMDEVEE